MPAAGGCTVGFFSQFCHFSVPLPASPIPKPRRIVPPLATALPSPPRGPPAEKPSGREKPPERKNFVLTIFSVSTVKKENKNLSSGSCLGWEGLVFLSDHF